MKETFTAAIWKENNWYIAQCREFEIASQGKTRSEALDNLAEAIELHFEPPVATIVPEIVVVEVAKSRSEPFAASYVKPC